MCRNAWQNTPGSVQICGMNRLFDTENLGTEHRPEAPPLTPWW
jgi:hypothetical protein